MARIYSAIKSPACELTIVTPRILSLPGFVKTLIKPIPSESVMARSK